MTRRTQFLGLVLAALVVSLTVTVTWMQKLAASYADPRAPAFYRMQSGGDPFARGRYLVKAADCAACHTASGGLPFAGGVKLESPFGTFYGSNITPDREYGIGAWSAGDFYRAVHDGVTPHRHLYPAMPYTSYHQLSRSDIAAMYAFLMAQTPVNLAVPASDLKFPYNLRFGVRFWNLLFLKDTLPDASRGQSTAWLRGRYLVNALGHCAECHTARGAFGQLDGAQPLQGAALARIAAPDITPAELTRRGWNGTDLRTFFSGGIAPQGSAFGDMYPVIHLSTQYLTHDDLDAISTYLLGDHAAAPKPAPLVLGRNVYLAVCAACHGADGAGKPHVAVALQGNSTVSQSDPHNLIVAILDGIPAQDFPGGESMQEMPGFAKQLSDAELAALVNYLRVDAAGQRADVTAHAVTGLRP
jgi:mono/diheme cytochrome c family protein